MAWYITDGILQRADSAPSENSILTDITGEGNIILPATVTAIADAAFRGCRNLTGITLPESLSSIGKRAFGSCIALSSLTLPDSVTFIGSGAFEACANLATITLSPNLTTIEKNTFHGCQSLKSILFPEGITSIGEGAFYCCSALSEIILPSSTAAIGASAFAVCRSLTGISLPAGITSIADFAFYCCNQLTDISLPEGITSIGIHAFEDCKALKSLYLPDGVLSIGNSAFSKCENLQTVGIPDSVTSISEAAFNQCGNLTSIILSESHPAFRLENGLLISKDGILLRCLADAESVVIPSDVTRIGESAFSDCFRLTDVTIPEGVTVIERNAFFNCTALTTITFPSSLAYIKAWAFHKCSSLKHIAFGEGLKSIERGAFAECTALLRADLPDSTKTIGEAFYNCPSLTEISLSAWSLRYSLENNEMKVLKSITCAIALKDAPAAARQKLCVGFALHEDKYSEELKDEYLTYIKKNAAKLVAAAFDYPALLHLMCREKLIAAKNIDVFTAEAAARGNVELTAVILDYQNSLGTKEVSKARDRKEKLRDKQDDIIVDRIAARADKVGIDGLNFVVTGGLTQFANRDDLKAYITSLGGKLMSAMSAKTDYLITNDTDSGSAKNKKAAELGIVVISEDEFLKMAEGKN